MKITELQKLKRLCGIGSEYQDSQNRRVCVSEENQVAVLKTIVGDISEQGIRKAWDELSARYHQCALPAVNVFRVGQKLRITLNVPDSFDDVVLSWQIDTEQNESISGKAVLSTSSAANAEVVECEGVHQHTFDINQDIPTGNHLLIVSSSEAQIFAQATLIIAPQLCYRQQALIEEKKLFGLSAQLYSLRSSRNWGIGDFSDLKQFVVQAAGHGVNLVGLNPMHALFPANPLAFSPYSPSNRAFLNVMYIDPQAIDEYPFCAEATSRVTNDAFQTELEKLRRANKVDYASVARCKFQILNVLFNDFSQTHLANNTARAKQFKSFVYEQGEALALHATYDALHETLLEQNEAFWGWSVWPEKYRQPYSKEVQSFRQAHADRVLYYQYLQWIAAEQLKAAQEAAIEAGMSVGLFLDFAVGINPGGSEAWCNQSLFTFQASVGAPPDTLATAGQDWGFPPFVPAALRASAYQLLIRNLRANMIHAGAIRFDHCVSLMRLWWIPQGTSPINGAYVNYSIDEIIAVLALQSHRNQCLVIGEDLGTVPAQLPKIMQDNAIYSYRVLYFEFADHHMLPPEQYPGHSVATLNTHDVAPLSSWWIGSDIELREQLGVLTDPVTVSQLKEQRDREKQWVLNAMHHYGYLQEHKTIDQVPSMTLDLNDAMHKYLASSNAAVMISQLEDWMDMHEPVNVPGTYQEYDNWRRKLDHSIDDFFQQKANLRRLRSIDHIRQNAACANTSI